MVAADCKLYQNRVDKKTCPKYYQVPLSLDILLIFEVLFQNFLIYITPLQYIHSAHCEKQSLLMYSRMQIFYSASLNIQELRHLYRWKRICFV